MDFRQVRAKAESESGYSRDPDTTNIYLGSFSNNEALTELCQFLKEETGRLGLKVNVFKTGSSGYYDFEPVLLIEKPAWPVVLYNNVTRYTIPAIIKDFLIGNKPRLELAHCIFGDMPTGTITKAENLPLFRWQHRVVLRNCGYIDPENISHYVLNGNGYQSLARCLEMNQEEILEELAKSGLRGRGGAGFFTVEKWKACRNAGGSEKYLVCNAVDGDPQALTARLLLEGDPHSVIEGTLIGAYAVGASHCFIVTVEENRLGVERLNTALIQARNYNLLGNNILNTKFSTEIEIKTVKPSLVAGEETALLQAIDGKQAMPYLRTSFPEQNGYRNKPTLINNIETLANIPVIFNRKNSKQSGMRGTKVVTLAGKTKHKYTVEVPLGTAIGSIVREIGGGTEKGEPIKAVQAGGPTGTFLGVGSLNIHYEYEPMKSAGAIIGSGTIEVFDSSSCAVEMAWEKSAFLQTQSCGKCVFCREGTVQIAAILKDINENHGKPKDLDLMFEIGELMQTSSICGLGKTAANPVLSSLRLFPDEFESHVKEKKCLSMGRI
jgi:NADH-quinone oxidoreductase subunit F